jgi:hypothetical protein
MRTVIIGVVLDVRVDFVCVCVCGGGGGGVEEGSKKMLKKFETWIAGDKESESKPRKPIPRHHYSCSIAVISIRP